MSEVSQNLTSKEPG